MCGSAGLSLGRRTEPGAVCERERKGEKKRRRIGRMGIVVWARPSMRRKGEEEDQGWAAVWALLFYLNPMFVGECVSLYSNIIG